MEQVWPRGEEIAEVGIIVLPQGVGQASGQYVPCCSHAIPGWRR